MARDVSVRMDEKGRVTLPRSIREVLHAEPGDVFYLHPESDGVRIIKGRNPFEALAEAAIREDDAGETVALDDIVRREGISFDK